MTRSTTGVHVSDSATEWLRGWSVSGLENLAWENADPEDLKKLRQSLPDIRKYLDEAIKGLTVKIDAEAVNKPSDEEGSDEEPTSEAESIVESADNESESEDDFDDTEE